MITSNISFIRGANTQESDVTAGPEKTEMCVAHLVRAARQLGTALPVRASRRLIRGNGRGGGSDVTSLWQLPDGK